MDVVDKLQIKPGESVHVVDAPPGFAIAGRPDARSATSAGAVIGFVTRRAAIARCRPVIAAATSGRLAWLAYPKAGQLGTDINRDSLRDEVAALGLDTVRQVAIDDIWSALRLRPAKD